MDMPLWESLYGLPFSDAATSPMLLLQDAAAAPLLDHVDVKDLPDFPLSISPFSLHKSGMLSIPTSSAYPPQHGRLVQSPDAYAATAASAMMMNPHPVGAASAADQAYAALFHIMYGQHAAAAASAASASAAAAAAAAVSPATRFPEPLPTATHGLPDPSPAAVAIAKVAAAVAEATQYGATPATLLAAMQGAFASDYTSQAFAQLGMPMPGVFPGTMMQGLASGSQPAAIHPLARTSQRSASSMGHGSVQPLTPEGASAPPKTTASTSPLTVASDAASSKALSTPPPPHLAAAAAAVVTPATTPPRRHAGGWPHSGSSSGDRHGLRMHSPSAGFPLSDPAQAQVLAAQAAHLAVSGLVSSAETAAAMPAYGTPLAGALHDMASTLSPFPGEEDETGPTELVLPQALLHAASATASVSVATLASAVSLPALAGHAQLGVPADLQSPTMTQAVATSLFSATPTTLFSDSAAVSPVATPAGAGGEVNTTAPVPTETTGSAPPALALLTASTRGKRKAAAAMQPLSAMLAMSTATPAETPSASSPSLDCNESIGSPALTASSSPLNTDAEAQTALATATAAATVIAGNLTLSEAVAAPASAASDTVPASSAAASVASPATEAATARAAKPPPAKKPRRVRAAVATSAVIKKAFPRASAAGSGPASGVSTDASGLPTARTMATRAHPQAGAGAGAGSSASCPPRAAGTASGKTFQPGVPLDVPIASDGNGLPARYHCTHPGCGASYHHQYRLTSHRVSHMVERPHACSQCKSAFARKHDLQRHVRLLHSMRRPFVCPACHRGFNRESDCERHISNGCRECKSSPGPAPPALPVSASATSTISTVSAASSTSIAPC